MSRTQDEDEDADDGRSLEREAWAERVEGVWNEILLADSRLGKPRVSLPGFPIEVSEALKTERCAV